MTRRWSLSMGAVLMTAAFICAQAPRPATGTGNTGPVGNLLTSATEERTYKAVPYQPEPGDIILYDDDNKFFHFLFKLARTAPPTHTAMVIAGSDGKPALLELTGPKVITARVTIMDIDERFRAYPGTIMVRKIREPLSPQQSRDLTQFAESQVGKPFAFPRIFLIGTPFCPRHGLRKELFGATYLNRNRWFCSELVVAGCATAKILDGRRCFGNATYPHDLAVDQRLDLSAKYHPPVVWTWDATPSAVPLEPHSSQSAASPLPQRR